jgi:hypothetical protein
MQIIVQAVIDKKPLKKLLVLESIISVHMTTEAAPTEDISPLI